MSLEAFVRTEKLARLTLLSNQPRQQQVPIENKMQWSQATWYEDPNVCLWTRLSDQQKSYLSKSVTSIILCNGDTTLFSCSGIAIDCKGNHLTRFLTSASLVRALNGTTNKDRSDLEIEVHHEGNEVYEGFLAEFDLAHNFAVVNVYTFLDVHVGLQDVLEIPPHDDVLLVALGRGISGKLITRTMMVSGGFRVSEDDEDVASKISEVWEGGPLFSLDGNFVGMNLFLTSRRAFFLPWNAIFEHLKQQVTLAYRFGARPVGKKSNSHLEVHGGLNQEQLDLDSNGYPKLPSTMLGASMILVNTFEDTFGDKHGEGVWSKLSRKASSNLHRSVVALASFIGEKRFFACTGFFIEWNESTVILTSASLVRTSGNENKIVKNLRIEVKFADDKWRRGELEHYCLPYNIAVVSVTNYHAHPANALVHWKSSLEVASVGRFFESSALMATTGKLVPWSGTLDCDFLIRSSCKITKAGIGGPVVTLDGDVIGMNFYDTRIGTPFLSWECICNILESFKGKSKAGEVGNDSDLFGAPLSTMAAADEDRLKSKAGEVGNVSVSCGASFCKMAVADKDRLNRWPVPMPCWRPRDYVDGDKSDDDGDDVEYTYRNGVKCILL